MSNTKLMNGVLILFACLMAFVGLSSYPLLNGQEGMSAQIAREMLLTRNFLVPLLNFTPHLDAPPLQAWMMSLSFALLGVNAFAARLFSALGLLGFIGFGFWFLKQCEFPKQARLWPWILLSSPLFIFFARLASGEIILALSISITLGLFYQYLHTQHTRFYTFACIALGLGILWAGFIAALLSLPVALACYYIVKRRHEHLPPLIKPALLFTFFVTLLPWLGMLLYNPELAKIYTQHNLFFRLLGITSLTQDVANPIYLYTLQASLMYLPWGLLLLVKAVQDYKQAEPLPTLTRFYWAWLWIDLAILSLTRIHITGFIMCLALPVAGLVSEYITQTEVASISRSLQRVFWLSVALIVFVALGFVLMAYKNDGILTPLEQAALLTAGLAFVYAIIATGLMIKYPKTPMLMFSVIVGLMLPLLLLKTLMVSQIRTFYSEYDLGQWLNAHAPEQSYFIYEDIGKLSSLLFYTKQYAGVILPEKVKHTHRQAIKTPYQVPKLTPSEFKRYASTQTVFVVVLDNKQSFAFHHAMQPLSFCQWYRDGEALLLTNDVTLCRQRLKLHYPYAKPVKG